MVHNLTPLTASQPSMHRLRGALITKNVAAVSHGSCHTQGSTVASSSTCSRASSRASSATMSPSCCASASQRALTSASCLRAPSSRFRFRSLLALQGCGAFEDGGLACRLPALVTKSHFLHALQQISSASLHAMLPNGPNQMSVPLL